MIPNPPASADRYDPANAFPPHLTRPVHCAMLAVDIVAFGSRDPGTQQHVRAGMYRVVEGACIAAGLPWSRCHREDRGDGILLIAPRAWVWPGDIPPAG